MEKLGIDGKILLAQIINYLILFWAFRKFLIKPFSDTLASEAKRKIAEEKKIKELEKKERDLYEEKLATEKKYEERLKEIYRKVKREADESKKQIVSAATAEAEEIRKHNLQFLAAEKEKSLGQVKKEAYKIALAMTEKVLSELTDKKLQQEIIAQVTNRLSKETTESYVN